MYCGINDIQVAPLFVPTIFLHVKLFDDLRYIYTV